MWGTTLPAKKPDGDNIISIHVPRVGDDHLKINAIASVIKFQSTSPAWGTTKIRNSIAAAFCISIHVPRVGDDVIPVKGF